MSKKRWSVAASLMLAVLMLVLSGCQAVGGLDLNQVLTKAYTQQSSESRQSMTLELLRDNSVQLTPQQEAMLALLGKVKVDITEAKVQDQMHVSMKGTIDFGKGALPFSFTMNDMNYTFWIEGAKQPIAFKQQLMPYGDMSAMPGATPEMKEQMAQLEQSLQQVQQKAIELMPQLSGFFIKNMPNPSVISVNEVSDAVNGEPLTLNQVHVELNGNDLLSLAKGFVTSVSADEQGLKEAIGVLYEVYSPMLQVIAAQATAAQGAEGAQNPMANILPILQNKELAVEFAFTYAKTWLTQFVANFDDQVAALLATEQGAKLKDTLLSKDQQLSLDYYIDKDNRIRKSKSSLQIMLPEGAGQGIRGLKLTESSEVFRIGEPVQADTIDTSAGVYTLQPENGRLTPSRFLTWFQPDSKLYKLLKDELHITKKNVALPIASRETNSVYESLGYVYDDNGTLMAPVRYVTEQLDGDVAWIESTKQIELTDPLTGTQLLLAIGSTRAESRGQVITLAQPVVNLNGTAYAPLKELTQLFGAKSGSEQGATSVTITRD